MHSVISVSDCQNSSNDQPNSSDTHLCNITVSEVDLVSIFDKLDTSKATGLDNISVKLLKGCKHVLCESLCALLNRAFEEGIFPDACKMANIIPVYKGKDNQDVTNYRPIIEYRYCLL